MGGAAELRLWVCKIREAREWLELERITLFLLMWVGFCLTVVWVLVVGLEEKKLERQKPRSRSGRV